MGEDVKRQCQEAKAKLLLDYSERLVNGLRDAYGKIEGKANLFFGYSVGFLGFSWGTMFSWLDRLKHVLDGLALYQGWLIGFYIVLLAALLFNIVGSVWLVKAAVECLAALKLKVMSQPGEPSEVAGTIGNEGVLLEQASFTIAQHYGEIYKDNKVKYEKKAEYLVDAPAYLENGVRFSSAGLALYILAVVGAFLVLPSAK
jgi:hypothetical protein